MKLTTLTALYFLLITVLLFNDAELSPNWVLSTMHELNDECTSTNGFSITIPVEIWDNYLTWSPNQGFHCVLHTVTHIHSYNSTEKQDKYESWFVRNETVPPADPETCLNEIMKLKMKASYSALRHVYRIQLQDIDFSIFENSNSHPKQSYRDYIAKEHKLDWKIWLPTFFYVGAYFYVPYDARIFVPRDSNQTLASYSEEISYNELLIQTIPLQSDPFTKELLNIQQLSEKDPICHTYDHRCKTNLGWLILDYPPNFQIPTEYCKLESRTDPSCSLSNSILRCPTLRRVFHSTQSFSPCEKKLSSAILGIGSLHQTPVVLTTSILSPVQPFESIFKLITPGQKHKLSAVRWTVC